MDRFYDWDKLMYIDARIVHGFLYLTKNDRIVTQLFPLYL